MKRYVIGDVHGGYKALKQVLKRAKFDYEKDMLISLGDTADGWSQTPQCFDELLKIKNLIYVIGNHDWWLYEWMQFDAIPDMWLSQGGRATLDAYIKYIGEDQSDKLLPHKHLLRAAPAYYELDGMVFVHGGFNWKKPIEEQEYTDLMWDRHMWGVAHYWVKLRNPKLTKMAHYDKIFIGHTSTIYSHRTDKPVKALNIWNLDQGGGYEGKLTIMDIDTEEYFQSDKVSDLYPEEKGR